jgi:acylglycerol lipase
MTLQVPDRIRTGHPIERLLVHLLVPALIAGCASPRLQEPSTEPMRARLGVESAVMDDGYRLPLWRWGELERPKALVLALHGFNDYANAFARLGPYLSAYGILTYAYDQRGFGATAQRGRWGGEERMIADQRVLTGLLRKRYPGIPLFLLGESMGGAVLMAAAAASNRTDGIVLVAPAVWSRDTMNPLQRLLLMVAAHTLPWLELTGRGIEIHPSDNLDMLRAFSADPLVIKGARVDALWGVTNMMDRAMAKTDKLSKPVLLLYGEHDQIIPKKAFCAMIDRISGERKDIRIVLYHHGWHMLTRDLQGARVMADIAAWIQDREARLPSGEEVQPGSHRLECFCGERFPPGRETGCKTEWNNGTFAKQ